MRDIRDIADVATNHASSVRWDLLSPDNKKIARAFTSSQVAMMCGFDLPHIKYRIAKEDLPAGTVQTAGSTRMFTLAETRVWTREYRAKFMRPAGVDAMTVAVANFKGGVSKSSTAMVLGQGLAVRGHRVLIVDLDPQGTLTTLNGVLPERDVTDEMTTFPLFRREEPSIRSAIRRTYWDGLDLVAAATLLYGAEFQLAALSRVPNSRFWAVLDDGLNAVRDEYDVIIIDTPPSLGFLTVNGLWAADGLLVPIPPTGLDFASSTQFWSLLADLGDGLVSAAGGLAVPEAAKSFEFLGVLMSKVDSADTSVTFVREWIQTVYGKHVLPVEIPKSSVVANQATEYGTVYDLLRYEGSAKTYRRAFDACERFVELMEQSCVAAWDRRLTGDAA
jgi:chromosome partitioning protein